MYIAICDDNKTQLYYLENAILNCSLLNKERLDIDTFSNGTELMRAVSGNRKYKLIFIDTDVINTSGVDMFFPVSEYASMHIAMLLNAPRMPVI